MKDIDILLVEDNNEDADLAMRAFKKKNLNLKILHIQDGADAIDYIFSEGRYSEMSGKGLPKMILMDLQLPKINGQDVLKRIKQDQTLKVIPTVILTSSSHQKDVSECYRLGANGYLVKPLDFEEYIHLLSKTVEFWLDTNYLPYGFSVQV